MSEREATFDATIVVDVPEGMTPEEALADWLACNDVSRNFELREVGEK